MPNHYANAKFSSAESSRNRLLLYAGLKPQRELKSA